MGGIISHSEPLSPRPEPENSSRPVNSAGNEKQAHSNSSEVQSSGQQNNNNNNMTHVHHYKPGPASTAVKDSWKDIKKQGLVDTIGMAVFVKLFEHDPETFQMFKTFRDDKDWKEAKGFKFHSKTVINVIGNAVSNNQDEETVRDQFSAIGTAHSFFDIKPRHFDIMRDELLKQLELHLKTKFKSEVREAWSQGYDYVAIAMQEYLSVDKNSTKLSLHAIPASLKQRTIQDPVVMSPT